MLDRFKITIDCLSDEERYLTIYIPDGYEEGSRFPVLYMFDGQNIFFDDEATYGKSWGMYDYLVSKEIPLIVVGIDSSRNPDNTRLCEYSPYDYDDYKFGFIKGLGKKHIKWLVEELKPYIDDNYPTYSDRYNTFIGGSSMGGLISYYATIAYNDVFSCAACLSPSLWANNEKLINLTKKAKLDPDTLFYLDYGSEETNGKFFKRANVSFWNCIEILKNKSINLSIKVVQGAYHNEESWERRVPTFIKLFLGEE